ncbi:hypothetical protein [Pseudoalteromonas phenolica]|uniref:hypothetical protein n=1 Tax=Pseudoalteromonas phenolica TaxID=161398 RepID=UPI00384F5332
MSINQELLPLAIENFRSILNSGFSSILASYESYAKEADSRDRDFAVCFDDYFHDWAQSNWELIVERTVCSNESSLVIYGCGSDYEAAAHSRVFFHSIAPTHEITCNKGQLVTDLFTSEGVDLLKYDFEGFVSFRDGIYDLSPPFDHILFTEKEFEGCERHVVISLNGVIWSAVEI